MIAAGTRLGSYEVLALLGQGGMGVVYEAEDTRSWTQWRIRRQRNERTTQG